MSAKNLSALGTLFSERRDFFISPQVTKEFFSSVTPLFTLAMDQGVDTNLKDPLFKTFYHRDPWIEQSFQAGDTASIAANDTAVVVPIKATSIVGLANAGGNTADASMKGLQFEVWDSTKTTRKGVVLAIDTVSGQATQLTFKNQSPDAISVAADDYFIVSGNARGEGTESPEAWADELSVIFGSTQIFKTPIEITGTLYEAALRGYSDELARLRVQKQKEHKFQIENALWKGDSVMGLGLGSGETLSDAARTDVDGKKVRTTMGVITAINRYGNTSGDEQNVFTINRTDYNYGNLQEDLTKVMQWDFEKGMRTAMCGMKAKNYFSNLANNQGFVGKSGWQVKVGDIKKDTLGYDFQMLETPAGILKLIYAPALRKQYEGYMVVLSPEDLKIKQYRGSKFQANIKTENAYDGVKDQYFSDLGIALTNIDKFALFKVV